MSQLELSKKHITQFFFLKMAFHLDMDCQKITSVFTFQKSIITFYISFFWKDFIFQFDAIL